MSADNGEMISTRTQIIAETWAFYGEYLMRDYEMFWFSLAMRDSHKSDSTFWEFVNNSVRTSGVSL